MKHQNEVLLLVTEFHFLKEKEFILLNEKSSPTITLRSRASGATKWGTEGVIVALLLGITNNNIALWCYRGYEKGHWRV